MFLISVACSQVASAQTLGEPAAPGAATMPRWLSQWSPLQLTGDLPRELPGTVSLPSLLTLPAPRVGSFWSAGNPAALPSDVPDSYAQFRFGVNRSHGSYKRPLDAGNDTRIGGTALGWKDLTSNGAAIGRLVVDHLDQNDGAHANVLLPHSSNPFVVLDTIGDQMSGIVMKLDGAGGWRIGKLGAGLGLGYESREIRTVASPVPRRNDVSAAAINGGLDYELANGALQLGVFGRWEQMAQTVLVSSTPPERTRIYVLTGYYEPTAIEPLGYSRRSDRNAGALGISATGSVEGVRWTVFGQSERMNEKQSVALENEPPADEWDADGWTVGFSAQTMLGDSLFLLTVTGRYSSLAGQAVRMDLEEINLEADETEWDLGGELRYLVRSGWTGALVLGTGRYSRQRQDLLARVGSDLNAWTPAAAIEVARYLPWGLALSAGVGYAAHAPWGSVPTPSEMSPAYQKWIAPELQLYGTDATTLTGTMALLWQAGPALSVWIQGTTASLSPSTGSGTTPILPDGSRKRSSIQIGLTMNR